MTSNWSLLPTYSTSPLTATQTSTEIEIAEHYRADGIDPALFRSDPCEHASVALEGTSLGRIKTVESRCP